VSGSSGEAERQLQAVTMRLQKIAVGSARLEARWLIEAAGADQVLCEAYIQRRLAGEPVDRIIGRRGFWTLDLIVTPDVLSPRPDSETIVEAARDHALLQHPKTAALRVLDLGTGTGALLLALLAEFPNATGTGVDVSPMAVDVARRNASLNGLASRATFATGHWAADASGFFDIIVSNPPYIPSGDIGGLETEVRDHDPLLALDGGADGLDCYREILPQIAGILAPGGIAVLEFGIGQGASVLQLAGASGLSLVEFRNDLSGIQRTIILNKIR
jgi:release factor glutamine methyltransferase